MKSMPATYYSFRHKFAGLVMILALVWLTVSLPFVYSFQQQGKHYGIERICTDNNPADDSNPFSGTTEEKSESGVNTLSEYLHHMHLIEHHFVTLTTYYKCHSSDLYLAYHPEMVSPPPDQA